MDHFLLAVEIYEGGGGGCTEFTFQLGEEAKREHKEIETDLNSVLIFSNLDSFIFGGGGDGKGKAEERKQVSGFSLYISK